MLLPVVPIKKRQGSMELQKGDKAGEKFCWAALPFFHKAISSMAIAAGCIKMMFPYQWLKEYFPFGFYGVLILWLRITGSFAE